MTTPASLTNQKPRKPRTLYYFWSVLINVILWTLRKSCEWYAALKWTHKRRLSFIYQVFLLFLYIPLLVYFISFFIWQVITYSRNKSPLQCFKGSHGRENLYIYYIYSLPLPPLLLCPWQEALAWHVLNFYYKTLSRIVKQTLKKVDIPSV